MTPFVAIPGDADGDMTTKEYTQQDVDDLVVNITVLLPKFEIKYKADSRLQRAIGWILSPFNSKYMSSYATTMFGKIWLPSGASQWSPQTLYKLLRHEFVHLMDAQKFWLLFQLTYLFVLPVVFTLRTFWELRGYTQTMLVEFEETGTIEEGTLDWIAGQFTGGLYLWMCPFKTWLRKRLVKIRKGITSREIRGYLYPFNKR